MPRGRGGFSVKVAVVARFLPPTIDAVGAYAYYLSHALAKRSVQVTLVTSEGQNALTEHPGVQAQPTVRNWGWLGVGHLMAVLHKGHPDVVSFQYVPQLYGRHGINFGAAALPLLLQIGLGTTVVTTYHELPGPPSRSLKGILHGIASAVQTALIVSGSTRVIAPAERQEEILRRQYPWAARRIVRIPVGSNIPVYPLKKDASAYHRPGPLFLGTFGSGHPWWQYEAAFRILRGLLDCNFQVRLLCIGNIEGSHRGYYQRLRQLASVLRLSDFIEWTGSIPSLEVSRRLQSVDVFLALHRTGITARSTAVAAALAHALPIVTTKGPDADQWLLESGAFIFIDVNDLPGAIGVVAALLRDTASRKEYGRRALALYQKQFSWEEIGGQFLDVISSSCGSCSSAENTRPYPAE